MKFSIKLIYCVQKSKEKADMMNSSLFLNHVRGPPISIPSLFIRILKKNVFFFLFQSPKASWPGPSQRALVGSKGGGQAGKGGSRRGWHSAQTRRVSARAFRCIAETIGHRSGPVISGARNRSSRPATKNRQRMKYGLQWLAGTG